MRFGPGSGKWVLFECAIIKFSKDRARTGTVGRLTQGLLCSKLMDGVRPASEEEERAAAVRKDGSEIEEGREDDEAEVVSLCLPSSRNRVVMTVWVEGEGSRERVPGKGSTNEYE